MHGLLQAVSQEKRALVTATPLKFTDPELASEPTVYVRYEKPRSRKIDLVYSEKVHGTTVDLIEKLAVANPTDKILVAYNSVSGCFDIAEHLVQQGILGKDEIKILCSAASRDKVKTYYQELSSESLPGRVNFITSAYFTGFDLTDQYHLITVSGSRSRVHSLSEKRIKQIAGRGRNGLKSETVVFDNANKASTEPVYTVAQLQEAAEKEIEALKCLEKHYSANPILRNSMEMIRKFVVASTGVQQHTFVRTDNDGNLKVAYLNIDAYQESTRVHREISTSKTALQDKLVEQGHTVNYSVDTSLTDVINQDTEERSSEELTKEVIDILLDRKDDPDVHQIVDELKSRWQKKIALIFLEYYTYIKEDELVQHLLKAGSKKDSRALDNFRMSTAFAVCDDSFHFKREFQYFFKVGSTYSPQYILDSCNKIFSNCSLNMSFSTEQQAIRFMKKLYKTSPQRGANKGFHKVLKNNPLGLTVIHSKSEKIETFKEMLQRINGEV